MAFRSLADVEEWVRKNGGLNIAGMAALGSCLQRNQFDPQATEFAREFVALHEKGARELRESEEAKLKDARQHVRAAADVEAKATELAIAERAATASESQAESAKQAVERSNIAIAISIVAIVLAAVDILTRH